jgi:general secretion pathway protein C
LKTGILTKRNISYLNIVLGVVLILSTLFLIRDTISNYFEKQKSVKRVTPAQTGVTTQQQMMQLADYSSILKNNPFGFSGGEIKPLTGSTDGKMQRTDIVLIGTVVGPKELSYGIFRDNAGMQEVFKIGESVFDLGKLDAVKKDKVIIKRAGNAIEFPLEDVKVKEIKKPGSQGTPSLSAFAQRVGKGTYIVDQNKLQQAISNPGQMMTDARLKPNISGSGKEEGFVLSEVKPGGIYNNLGLQDGDVLLRINEYDITNPERALQAFTALKGLDRVQVDLIRTGARMTMTYQIR